MRESILRHEWEQLRQFLRHEWKKLRHLLVRWRPRREIVQAGFTILELLLVTVIIGTLSTMAAPRLDRARTLAQIAATGTNIRIIEAELSIYIESNFAPPETLAAIGRSSLRDPWGNLFVYQSLFGANKGNARKDKFLVPLNSDYDLYSMGADGKTKKPLSPPDSHDDIIRALDGAYVGLASEF